jgi:hypothetical protein
MSDERVGKRRQVPREEDHEARHGESTRNTTTPERDEDAV